MSSLANVLLVEQLADVDTTQSVVHDVVCAQPVPLLGRGGAKVGAIQTCLRGGEVDPLARPFVMNATSNTIAAVAMNGLVRLAFRRANPRILRLFVELYPAVVLGNLLTARSIRGFAPSASFAFRFRIESTLPFQARQEPLVLE